MLPKGLHSSGLRFGDPRVMAVFSSLVAFSCLVAGFDNRRLVEQVSALLDAPYTSRQASYDLRRLRRKGLMDKVPRKRQYHWTPLGRKVAVLFIKAYGRVLAPGLTALDPQTAPGSGSALPSGDGLASVRPLVERLCRRAITRCLTLLDQFVNFFSTKGSLVGFVALP